MHYPLIPAKESKSKRFKVWFNQAKFDIEASKFSSNGSYYEWSCYQSTQAVEKALKAIIMHAGYRHPKTHKLSVLIGLCNSLDSKFKNSKFKFRDLEIYTFVSRYPFLLPGEHQTPHEIIKEKDSNECIFEAESIMDIVGELLDLPFVPSGEIELEKLDIPARIEFVKNKLVEGLNPEKIILFGSYGRGETEFSTLDILIVADSDKDFVDRVREVRELTKGGLPVVHPVFYTPKEFDEFLEEGHSLIENALAEGKVLYSK